MSNLFDTLKDKIQGKEIRIVLPEALDERVLGAAVRLNDDNLVKPILIGDEKAINDKAASMGIDVSKLEIYNPYTHEMREELAKEFVERRKGKVDYDQAIKMIMDENYYGTMLVHVGKAEGLVSGAAHSTADTVRPALQIIKTKPGVAKTSGVFIMTREEEKYVFGDCAINITPSASDLAEIAIESAKTAEIFGVSPRVAMLSFSTKGSAKSPETEKVIEATEIAKEKAPELTLDGEFQFDAAFVPSVAEKKAPGSVLKGDANVFVFPSLEAGNIGYKIAQRLGDFEAIGPILQGLNKPVNDLSRGCNEEDVYKLAIITAAQAL